LKTYFSKKTHADHDGIFEVIASGLGLNQPKQIVSYIIENVILGNSLLITRLLRSLP